MRHPSICMNCGYTVTGNYCEQCGQKTTVTAITLPGILHEVFHYFTHLDRGFGFTLKKLITSPGTMQRRFIEGERNRHQKPFAMFFISGAISGLGFYLVNVAQADISSTHNPTAEDFYRHYFVILHAVLLPLYTLVTWLCFRRQKFNYAETLVMMLYAFSLVYLVLLPVASLKLLFPDFENRIAEMIFILVYLARTNLHFYEGQKWKIGMQTVLSVCLIYGVSMLFNEMAFLVLQ